jgi:DNA-binding transcriptional regulator YiaG
MAKLMNVNVSSVKYREPGKSRPRKEAVAALAAIRESRSRKAAGDLLPA